MSYRIHIPELNLVKNELEVAIYSSLSTREVYVKYVTPKDSDLSNLVSVLHRKNRFTALIESVFETDIYTLRMTQSQFTWVKYLFKPSK